VFLKSTMLFAMLYLLATISVECKGCTSRPHPTQYSRVQGRETSARVSGSTTLFIGQHFRQDHQDQLLYKGQAVLQCTT
jgi:hypothetical protein